MPDLPESCPVEECNAEIVDSEIATVGTLDSRARDPRTERVVTCAEGHQRVV
ncbi:hypothetical protein [Haloarcula montana]|uniref:hypothetical protein n=1 Tax=Haloarcula montana TaxID=3111776 RepID=UPI002D76EAE6|nr:hypothetical protein [Haloarcula sp. GH36]